MHRNQFSTKTDSAKFIRRQRLQIEHLRKKVFLLQELMITNSSQKACALNSPFAPIFPVEQSISSSYVTTIISFGGMLSSLGMAPKEFMNSLYGKGVNLLFIKDFQQCWYQQGLLGISNNIDETVEFIRQILPQNQHHIRTVGTSAGGFAALLFGALLGADKILAFGPQTIVNKKTFNKFKSVDSREKDMGDDGRYLDLVKLLGSINYAGEAHLHFAGENKIDSAAAERLRDFSSVHLHPYKTNNHNIAGWLKRDGKLDEVLAFLLC